jgi:hypothetical protein
MPPRYRVGVVGYLDGMTGHFTGAIAVMRPRFAR